LQSETTTTHSYTTTIEGTATPPGRPTRHVDDRRSLARLALMCSVHVALAIIGFAVDRWFVWAVVWAVQAVNMLTLVAMTHECVHLHFVRSRTLNRVLGTLAAAFIWAPFEVYRSRHIGHHADTCGPDDTEGEPYKFRARWQIVASFLAGGIAYILSLPVWGLAVSLGWSPRWVSGRAARRRIRINMVVWGATAALGVVLAMIDLRVVAFAWLIPVAIFLTVPFVFVLMPEHYDAPGPGHVTSNTRTCVSNAAMRFVFLNTNLHTAHHDRASVPWTGLPAHHAELASTIDNEWVFSGYFAFYRFMWRNVSRGV
jgi:fatty acid desaturase